MVIQIIAFAVVLVIVFYFLRQESRKEGKYFGKKVAPNRKERKIFEKYREEYEPIGSDVRLAKLENDKWELEDIAKSATEVIYDSPIPTKSQKQNLKTGDLVKLKFLIDEGGEVGIERIWVEVTGEKDGLFSGELDNQAFNDILKPGQLIWFHPNHVFEIGK